MKTGCALRAQSGQAPVALIPALLAGQEPPVPARRGLRALELAYAVIESFQTGRRIEVEGGLIRLQLQTFFYSYFFCK